MLELSIQGGVPESLYYDEIVVLEVAYAGPDRAAVTVQANAHGKSLDGTKIALPLYEHEFSLQKETKQAEVHLKFVNQSLSDLRVEFSAVAVVGGKREPAGAPAAAPAPALAFSIMNLTPVPTTATPAAAPLGREVASASISARLMPCLEISVHYVRPGLEKDSALCQFDFVAFDAALEVQELEFRLHQGKITPLVPLALPLAIEPGGTFAFAMRMETLLSASSSTAHAHLSYTCGGRPIRSQWSSRLGLAESLGPAPKTPQAPQAVPHSKRSSAISQQSLLSASSQTAIYPSSIAPAAPSRSSLAGVSIHIAGPNKVRLGQEFEWTLTFLNKTSRTRKLGLLLHSREPVIPSLSRYEERALVSDVYTLLKRIQVYRSAIGEVMGVVPLVPSVRIGQLGAYSSFSASIRFLAVERGLHSVSGGTIQDLSTGDLYETGRLLEVMVE